MRTTNGCFPWYAIAGAGRSDPGGVGGTVGRTRKDADFATRPHVGSGMYPVRVLRLVLEAIVIACGVSL